MEKYAEVDRENESIENKVKEKRNRLRSWGLGNMLIS